MLVLTCLYCMGRVLHATGYVSAYGKHGKGFALSMLAVLSAEGLLLIGSVVGFMKRYG